MKWLPWSPLSEEKTCRFYLAKCAKGSTTKWAATIHRTYTTWSDAFCRWTLLWDPPLTKYFSWLDTTQPKCWGPGSSHPLSLSFQPSANILIINSTTMNTMTHYLRNYSKLSQYLRLWTLWQLWCLNLIILPAIKKMIKIIIIIIIIIITITIIAITTTTIIIIIIWIVIVTIVIITMITVWLWPLNRKD